MHRSEEAFIHNFNPLSQKKSSSLFVSVVLHVLNAAAVWLVRDMAGCMTACTHLLFTPVATIYLLLKNVRGGVKYLH